MSFDLRRRCCMNCKMEFIGDLTDWFCFDCSYKYREMTKKQLQKLKDMSIRTMRRTWR